MMQQSLEASLNLRNGAHSFREGRFVEMINHIRAPAVRLRLPRIVYQLNFIHAVPEEIGGNHYHKFKEEEILLYEGRLRLVLENPETKERLDRIINAPSIFSILPGIAHALTPANGDARYAEIASLSFDPKDEKRDVHPYILISPKK